MGLKIMEIIDKRKGIGLADMAEGQVYKITLKSNEEYYIMLVYNGNLNINYDFYRTLVDLKDGCLFDYDSKEVVKIEEVDAKLIIK